MWALFLRLRDLVQYNPQFIEQDSGAVPHYTKQTQAT
jgi:hypothetical protein